MKYFFIQKDGHYGGMPAIQHIPTTRIPTAHLRDKAYHLFPDITTLPIYEGSAIDFVDILSSPFLLVSELCFDVIKMYHPYTRSKKMVLMNKDTNKVYHLPLIPRISCLTENSKLNIDKSYIECAELEYEKVKRHELFYIGDSTSNYAVIRLDMLESMLKRGARGFGIKEVDVRGL